MLSDQVTNRSSCKLGLADLQPLSRSRESLCLLIAELNCNRHTSTLQRGVSTLARIGHHC